MLSLIYEEDSFGVFVLVTVILVLTVIFANYAEAVAEGRGRAQAATLRKTKKETPARRVLSNGSIEMVTSITSSRRPSLHARLSLPATSYSVIWAIAFSSRPISMARFK